MQKNNYYTPKIQYIKYNPQVESYNSILQKEASQETKNEKLESFKNRLLEFKKVSSLEDAKELLQKTMPTVLERTTFYIGDAKCSIINSSKRIKICFDSKEELISYDFV